MEKIARDKIWQYSKEERLAGLKSAIESTKARIEEHKIKGWDASELEKHLGSLEEQLMKNLNSRD